MNSIDEAIVRGKEMLAQWLAYEDITVKLIQSQLPSEGNHARLTYAPFIEGVIANDQVITLEISVGDSQELIVRLDAFRYFARYNYPHNYTAQLTEDEAVAALSPQLTATGKPRLEIKRGTQTLVYAIPVTGVKWVDMVYINAATGLYEGMEYDYSRP